MDWFKENVAEDFPELRSEVMVLLQKEKELQEIVQLIGEDALPDSEKIVLRTTRIVRESFLQQNAFVKADSFCPLEKQYKMLKNIVEFHHTLSRLFQEGASLDALMNAFRPHIAEMNNFKYYEDKEFEEKLKSVNEFFDTVQMKDLEETVTA